MLCHQYDATIACLGENLLSPNDMLDRYTLQMGG